MDQSLEATGRTVDEAIQHGLDELELELDDVDVDVLSEGRSGLLGLRTEEARVRLTPRPDAVDGEFDDDEAVPAIPASLVDDAQQARDILAELLRLMEVDATIDLYVPGSDPTVNAEPGEPIVLNIEREDAGLLIGRRGASLRHLQTLLTTIVSRRLGHYVPLRVDVESYQQRQMDRIEQIALRAADHVRRRHRSITLDPMSPADRRIIHITLADNPAVVTHSTGQGEDRRVTIALVPTSGGGGRSGGASRPPARAAAPPVFPPQDDLDEEDEYDDDEYEDDDIDDEDDDDTEYEDDDDEEYEDDDEYDDDDDDEYDDDEDDNPETVPSR